MSDNKPKSGSRKPLQEAATPKGLVTHTKTGLPTEKKSHTPAKPAGSLPSGSSFLNKPTPAANSQASSTSGSDAGSSSDKS